MHSYSPFRVPAVQDPSESVLMGGVSEEQLEMVEERLTRKFETRFETVESGVARMERMLVATMAALNVPPVT